MKSNIARSGSPETCFHSEAFGFIEMFMQACRVIELFITASGVIEMFTIMI